MAEEQDNDIQRTGGLDDTSAIRMVLRSVKGISPISLAPAVDEVALDSRQHEEQYQFE